jgi:hypothetical protein
VTRIRTKNGFKENGSFSRYRLLITTFHTDASDSPIFNRKTLVNAVQPMATLESRPAVLLMTFGIRNREPHRFARDDFVRGIGQFN